MLRTIDFKIKHSSKIFRRTSGMVFAILLYAITFNLFLRPNNIIIGGMGGIAMIINHYLPYDISLIVAIMSMVFLTVGYFTLERKMLLQTVLAAVCYPIFIKLTYNIGSYISIDQNELLVIAIFAGIMLGTSDGIVEKMGFNTGGTDIVSKLIVKKTKIIPGNAILFVEGMILLLGLFVYGSEQFMYAIVVLYILNFVASKIMLSISKRKVFYIYTDDVDDIKTYIHSSLGYDVTIMQNKNEGHHQSILMSVVDTNDYFALREGVEEIDPHAKIIIFDSYEYFERHGKTREREQLIKEAQHESV